MKITTQNHARSEPLDKNPAQGVRQLPHLQGVGSPLTNTMKYKIELSAKAIVTALVTIEAESIADAEKKALDFAVDGDPQWCYDGLDFGTTEVTAVYRICYK